MNKRLTNEQVDRIEDNIRAAQKALEEAAQILCPVPGEVAPGIYARLSSLAEETGEAIHRCYLLRP